MQTPITDLLSIRPLCVPPPTAYGTSTCMLFTKQRCLFLYIVSTNLALIYCTLSGSDHFTVSSRIPSNVNPCIAWSELVIVCSAGVRRGYSSIVRMLVRSNAPCICICICVESPIGRLPSSKKHHESSALGKSPIGPASFIKES